MSFNYVRLDVGSYLHLCHKTTIERFPDSVLAKCISPQFDKRKSEHDFIVIDRDGKHFGAILNYMRDSSSLNLSDWTKNDLNDLIREADYYCLTALVELCRFELDRKKRDLVSRSTSNTSSTFPVPINSRLLIVFGLANIRSLLKNCKKQTLVVSYQNMVGLHIVSWIEELVNLCDHSRFNVYCSADRGDGNICSGRGGPLTSKDFIVALYNPNEMRFSLCLSMPDHEKFRTRRAHYKCKLFKFWLLIQNSPSGTNNMSTSNSHQSVKQEVN